MTTSLRIVVGFHGYPRRTPKRIKRRKVRFHGFLRNKMISRSKNLMQSHGSRSSNLKTKKMMMIGWSLRIMMDQNKRTRYLGVPNNKNSSPKGTSSSRKRKSKITSTSTTNLTAKWILTVHKNWTPKMILSSINHSKVIILVRDHVILHHKIRFNRPMETLKVKNNL